MEQEHEIVLHNLEYGPGLEVDYFGGTFKEIEVFEECMSCFTGVASKRKLTLELGRFLTADCGSYITEIIDVKHNEGKNYCIVDGGIHHVNYYGQVMGVRIPPIRYFRKVNENYVEETAILKEKEGICVCGSLCTAADVLIRNISFKEVKSGDIFIFEKMGAYSITEGIYLFLSRKMPLVYFWENNNLFLVRNTQETYVFNDYQY